jgi:heme exporter protein C
MGGNNTFNNIDSRMRIIFWFGAIPGWTLLGTWITTLRIRLKFLEEKKFSNA